jgi:hypothetical protein
MRENPFKELPIVRFSGDEYRVVVFTTIEGRVSVEINKHDVFGKDAWMPMPKDDQLRVLKTALWELVTNGN